MIDNEGEYRATKDRAAQFEAALGNLRVAPDREADRQRRELEIAAVQSQLADLVAEIAAYEALHSGG